MKAAHFISQVLVLLAGSSSVLAKDRKLTIKNSCAAKVCPGVDQSAAKKKLSLPNGKSGNLGGWCLGSGESTVLTLPGTWSGKFWGRTGCDEGGKCVTGNCGGVDCTGGNEGSVTLAEITTFDGSNAQEFDFYDISLVDGFNIPASLSLPGSQCPTSSCEGNANAHCPDELRTSIDKGTNMACMSACKAGFGVATVSHGGGSSKASMNCCSGPWASPENCPKDCIDYYGALKDACSTGYAVSNLENHKNSLGSCPGDQPDYELEFCPGGSSYEGNAGGDTKYLNQIASHETCAAKPLLPGWSIVEPATLFAGGGKSSNQEPQVNTEQKGIGSPSSASSTTSEPTGDAAIPPAPVNSAASSSIALGVATGPAEIVATTENAVPAPAPAATSASPTTLTDPVEPVVPPKGAATTATDPAPYVPTVPAPTEPAETVQTGRGHHHGFGNPPGKRDEQEGSIPAGEDGNHVLKRSARQHKKRLIHKSGAGIL
ncbi:hypothetical protein FFLO_06919 [Filobasidium floriforme]|uniref:Osmotin, thaumatin-like protein n=1 Tax=Filobasidium floriforme TaxID=5210 RepID=A0A8K0JEB2_9TREE|nr:hypothetical protein FFLO_06919 [Filobasidium floriforme]